MALWQKTVAPFSEQKGGVGSFLKIPRSNSVVSMEIVSFCRMPLCNFQYRNHVHSITLISFQIISQNLLQI